VELTLLRCLWLLPYHDLLFLGSTVVALIILTFLVFVVIFFVNNSNVRCVSRYSNIVIITTFIIVIIIIFFVCMCLLEGTTESLHTLSCFFPCCLLPTGESLLRPRLPASLHLPDLLLAAPAAKDRDGIVRTIVQVKNAFV
jgi:amino acid transporter